MTDLSTPTIKPVALSRGIGEALRRQSGQAPFRSGASPAGPGRDGLAAMVFGRHVPHGLGELPSIACHILHGAVPLAVLPIRQRFELARSVRCAQPRHRGRTSG